MSRNIQPKDSVTITEEEIALRRTDNANLLLTSYRGRDCALLIQDNRLTEASFFSKDSGRVGAIYIGKVKKTAKNIDACFVEIAKGEICFLSMKNAVYAYILNRSPDGRILEGDEILVQVERDAQKAKRASVTAHISLSNDYFAIVSGTDKAGYSQKLSKERKDAVRRIFTEAAILENGCLRQDCGALVSIAEGKKMDAEGLAWRTVRLPLVGVVARTRAGEVESAGELLEHFFRLSAQFVRMMYIAMHRSCFSCLKEADAGFEAMLPLAAETGAEIITDQEPLYHQLQNYMAEHGQQNQYKDKIKLRLYQDAMLPLSALYSVDKKLETALGSRVWLKSGGYLIIEPTEALTVIDVNSGKNEKGRDAEDAFLRINMEAAEEVAIQLRLRNLSGIIIVDFINMQSGKDNALLLNRLRTLVKQDKVKTTVVDMTSLGLVEITRKKINRPLKEQFASCAAGAGNDGH